MKKFILIFCILFSCFIFKNATAQVNYQWVKSIGSGAPGNDIGKSIAVDISGNVYTTGYFAYGSNANFNPLGSTPKYLSTTGLKDCFFAKYAADGECSWANSLRLLSPLGQGGASGTSIAVDGASNVYILGVFVDSVDFNPDPALTYTLYSAGGLDCFFAKYDQNGVFQWAKRFGGSGDDLGTGIAVTPNGNDLYVTGYYNSSDATIGNQSTTDNTLPASSSNDIFLARYNTDGTYVWANAISGSGSDIAYAIDASDSYVTITGSFQGLVDFDPGAGSSQLNALASKGAFVVKYHDDGSVGWANYLGDLNSGSSTATGTGVAIDANNVYVTGFFNGTFFFDADSSKQSIGYQDVFFAKYYISNDSLAFGHTIGSVADSVCPYDITVDPSGNLYLTGSFRGTADFDPSTGGNNTLTSSGLEDIFFAKYTNDGDHIFANRLGSSAKDVGWGIAVDNSENIHVTGSFQGTVNFDPGAGTANRTGDAVDIFIAKYRQMGTATIAGYVTRSSNGDTINIGPNNYAELYTQLTSDGNIAMHLVETTPINQQGHYSFTNLNTDSYRVLAIADSGDYQYAVPTYFGDTTHWEGSPMITTTPNTSTSADIIIQESEINFFTGTATLSGSVLGTGGYDHRAGVTPIIGVPIGLEGDPGSIKANTTTNINGEYTFRFVPPGNYKIYVNIPGLPMDSTYHVNIAITDSITDLDFIADSSSINIVPTPAGVTQIAPSKIKMQVYPNPYKDFTTIELTLVEANQVQIEVYNLLGEKVADLLNEKKQAGIVKYKFNAANAGLKVGLYMLKVKVGDETITKKITKTE